MPPSPPLMSPPSSQQHHLHTLPRIMGEEEKLMEAYISAENLWLVTENLLAKVKSEKERGVHINPNSLSLIYHYIFKIQSLLRDMNVAMVSSADSIPNRKLWQSRERLVYGDVSWLYSRLQKLLDHPNPDPKVESNFDHPGLDVDDKCISSSFVGVNSSHCVIDTMEDSPRPLSWWEKALQGSARPLTCWEKALQESPRPLTWWEKAFLWWEMALCWIALTLIYGACLYGVCLAPMAKIFCRILGI